MTDEPIFAVPYAKLREELNEIVAIERNLHASFGGDRLLKAIQTRLLVDIADSLDRIADNLILIAGKP